MLHKRKGIKLSRPPLYLCAAPDLLILLDKPWLDPSPHVVSFYRLDGRWRLLG